MRRQGHGSLTTPTACPSVYYVSPKEHHRQKGSMVGSALKADTILMYWLNYNDHLLPAASSSPPALSWCMLVDGFEAFRHFTCAGHAHSPCWMAAVCLFGVWELSPSPFFLVSCKKQTPCNDGFQTWPIILLLVILLVWGPCPLSHLPCTAALFAGYVVHLMVPA